MNLMKKRWILLIVACTINLCAGSIYAWSVFAPPLAERLSILTGEALTAGSLAAAFSLANAVGPIPMILGGAVNDRFGPRWVIAPHRTRLLSCCRRRDASRTHSGLRPRIRSRARARLRLDDQHDTQVLPRPPGTCGGTHHGALWAQFRHSPAGRPCAHFR